MEAKMKEYNETLEIYQQMVAQMAFNRGGNPTLIRILKLKLEKLKKEITQNLP
jgi:hypothetical protein